MALALDASTPALATGTSQVASASLTSVPANALLVVIAGHDTVGADSTSSSVVTGGSLTWTKAATRSKADDPATAQPGHLQVSWARFAAGGSITVTSTGTNTNSNCCIQVLVFTGALAAGTPMTTAEASQGSAISISLTTTAANSWVWVGMEDWQGISVPTPVTGWTTQSSQQAIGGSFTFWCVKKNATTATAGTTETLTNTDSGSGRQDNLIIFEVLEEPAGTTAKSGTDTGTLSDTSSLAIATNLTDSAALAEVSSGAGGNLTGADSGTLSGVSALAVDTPTTDAGTVTDSSALAIVTADTAALTDTASAPNVAVTTSDSARLSEVSTGGGQRLTDGTMVYHLNRLAGTLSGGVPTQSAVAAANTWAGTSGLSLVDALNEKAGAATPALELAGIANQLASTVGLTVTDALSRIP